MAAVILHDGIALAEALNKLADEIAGSSLSLENTALIGIHTRGVVLARRLETLLNNRSQQHVLSGILDITFYRDDLATRGSLPEVKETRIDFDITGKDIILVDDVIYTGRSIKAALETLMSFGRPRSIKLLVLVDRGHRELPIQPDFTAFSIPTEPGDDVEVHFAETDLAGDRIILVPGSGGNL